jgi:hypothetical protein
MKDTTISKTIKLIPVEKIIKATANIVEDTMYELTKEKSPKIKRTKEDALAFWSSINIHLTELQKIKENEQK